MTVVGYASHNTRTCFVGEECVVDRLVGFPVSDGDRLMAMYSDRACGEAGGEPHWFGGDTWVHLGVQLWWSHFSFAGASHNTDQRQAPNR